MRRFKLHQMSRRKTVAAAAAVVITISALAAIGGVALLRGGDTAAERLDQFLVAWSSGLDDEAAALTNSPTLAAEGLAENRAGLDGAEVTAVADGEMASTVNGQERPVSVTWQVPEIGEFAYETRVTMVEDDESGWVVNWRPDLVHPDLGTLSRLGTVREFAERGKIVDRDGEELVGSKPVRRVGVIAGEIDRPGLTAQRLAEVLDIDPGPLAAAIRGGGPEQFVEAISLRLLDYDAVARELAAIPEVEVIDGTAQLAPSREFARQLLGAVGELTAEQLDQLGPPYVTGDSGGQWGLQAQFERELAGTPRRAVVIRVQGVPTEELLSVEGEPGTDLQVTLDLAAQAAAEEALAGLEDEETTAALVAVQPSTGDLLAVANRPVDDTFNRALEGQYPPGSTFKIVSAAALLDADVVTPESTVECPLTFNAGGREFQNFEGGGGTSMSFSQAFAESCNTAFVSLAPELRPPALRRAGQIFGLGAERAELSVPVYEGQVPVPEDEVQMAAAMIGQDRILASPAGMAGVMATVADGRWRAPRLIEDDPSDAGRPLPEPVLDYLRDLTRLVVTSGTGTALASLSGEVHGKSGTAEFGDADPPETHAWFVAYRDDLAVAVLVEGGEAGGTVAAPIVAAFFEQLDAS